jgi:hypothetical protein
VEETKHVKMEQKRITVTLEIVLAWSRGAFLDALDCAENSVSFCRNGCGVGIDGQFVAALIRESIRVIGQPNRKTREAIKALDAALRAREENAGLRSLLVLRAGNEFCYRRLSGWSLPSEDASDQELFAFISSPLSGQTTKEPSPEVRKAIRDLEAALREWERNTGVQSVLVIREEGGFYHRSVSGTPCDWACFSDQKFFEYLDLVSLPPSCTCAEGFNPECEAHHTKGESRGECD